MSAEENVELAREAIEAFTAAGWTGLAQRFEDFFTEDLHLVSDLVDTFEGGDADRSVRTYISQDEATAAAQELTLR